MSPNTNKFIKGVISGYLFTIVSLLVSLWLVPFVLSYLTKSEYGIFIIIVDLLAWLSLANLGTSAAFGSKAGHLLGSKNTAELNQYTSTVFLFTID